jgi:hypothetical protein
MIFLVQVYDACCSEGDVLTFESAEQAATALGIEWKPGYAGSKITHRAEVPRGDWFAYDDPESYDAAAIAEYNKSEPLYASGLYAEPGKRINWDD